MGGGAFGDRAQGKLEVWTGGVCAEVGECERVVLECVQRVVEGVDVVVCSGLGFAEGFCQGDAQGDDVGGGVVGRGGGGVPEKGVEEEDAGEAEEAVEGPD